MKPSARGCTDGLESAVLSFEMICEHSEALSIAAVSSTCGSGGAPVVLLLRVY